MRSDHGGGAQATGAASLELSEQLAAMLNEHRQIRLDRTPDHTVAHVQVLVGEQVAEVDDLAPLRDRGE